ncbi:MAG: heavy metal-binding domain-containing protein [Candidatus Aminicenantia bacterium]
MKKHSKILTLFLVFSFVLVLAGIAQQQAEETVTCPVSGKEMKKSEAKASYEYKGKTYYFCCEKCKEKFMKDPEQYIQKKAEMKEVYTCPMHSELKSDKPGKCPKCGMKLEKKMMVKKHMHAHMKAEGKACCTMMHLMGCKDAEINVENLEDGVAVKITSKNAEVVKKIQEVAAKMKASCPKKAKECKKKKTEK